MGLLLKGKFSCSVSNWNSSEILVILTAMNTTELVAEMSPEKNSGLYRIWTHDLCDTSAVLYQLS